MKKTFAIFFINYPFVAWHKSQVIFLPFIGKKSFTMRFKIDCPRDMKNEIKLGLIQIISIFLTSTQKTLS